MQQGIESTNNALIEALIPLYAERTETLKQLAEQIRFMFEDFTDFDAKAAKKHLKIASAGALSTLKGLFESINEWSTDSIQKAIDETMTTLDIGMGKIGMPLRVAVTGGGQSPSVDAVMELVGKERVIARIKMALEFIAEREANA